jgi:hypothetical protein
VSISRQQLPFAPAYGVTIHKSQGLSLDYVLIDTITPLHGAKRDRHGMVYVALSRVRTSAGLRFLGKPSHEWLHQEIPKELVEEDKRLDKLFRKFLHESNE